MSLIRVPRYVSRSEPRRVILARVTGKLLQALLITAAAAVLAAFLDRESPETKVAQIVLAVVTGIMVLTVLTADDE